MRLQLSGNKFDGQFEIFEQFKTAALLHPFNYRNYDQFLKMAAELSTYQGFKVANVKVEGILGATFVFRDLLETAAHLFAQPYYSKASILKPYAVKTVNNDNAYMSFASSQAWSTKYQELRDKGTLHQEDVLMPIFLYSDKTLVSDKQSLWPMIAYLGVHDPELVSQASFRAVRTVALLPIASMDGPGNDSNAANRRRALFHGCLGLLLGEDFQAAQKLGMKMTGPDGKVYKVFPWISGYSCDIPEAASICMTRGVQGEAPCHTCLIPKSSTGANNLDEHRSSTLRTIADLRNCKNNADLKKLGLWNEPNALHPPVIDNVFQLIAPDSLHQVALGVIPELVQLIKSGLQHGRSGRTKNELWNKFQAHTSRLIPRFHSFPSRSKCVAAVQLPKAHEWDDLLKVIVPAISSIYDASDKSSHLRVLVDLTVAVANFVALLRSKVPTDTILASSDKWLNDYYRLRSGAITIFDFKLKSRQATTSGHATMAHRKPMAEQNSPHNSSSDAYSTEGTPTSSSGSGVRSSGNSIDLASDSDDSKSQGDSYADPLLGDTSNSEQEPVKAGAVPIKPHSCSHYKDAIKQHGPLDAQSTQRGEQHHSAQIKIAAKRTNYSASMVLQASKWIAVDDALHDTAALLYWYHRGRLTSVLAREFEYLDILREWARQRPISLNEQPIPLPGSSFPSNCRKGREYESFRLDPQLHPQLFRQLALYMAHLLQGNVRTAERGRVEDEWVKPSGKIIVYQTLKLTFWSPYRQQNLTVKAHARVKPVYGNQLQQDGVMYIQDTTRHHSPQVLAIGRLIHILQFVENDEVHQLAYIQRMHVQTGNHCSGMIVLRNSDHFALIPTSSIRQVVHLVPIFGLLTEHFYVNHYADPSHTFHFLSRDDIRKLVQNH